MTVLLINEITPEMWRLWEESRSIFPAVKLGGIYAPKKGYHNTVNNNIRFWPLNNYSIRAPLDMVKANRDRARAIDLTMSTENMIKWTQRMKNSALHPVDPRLNAVREFYGTLDGKTVYGLIKDTETGNWRKSSADSTHLWHGHMGIFTYFVNNWNMLNPILSVWRGEAYQDWIVMKFLPRLHDSGEDVVYWQYAHNNVRGMVTPVQVEIKPDGDYGPATANAFAAMYKALGGTAKYDGSYLSGWVALRYMQLLARREAQMLPKPQIPAPVIDDAKLKEVVENWLAANVTGDFFIDGKVRITHDISSTEPS